MRILHILPADADSQTERAVAGLASGLARDADSDIRTIGAGGHWRHVPAAYFGLRCLASYDVVHAWGVGSLVAAAIGAAGRLVFSATNQPLTRTARWVRAIANYRPVEVVASSATQQHELISRGVEPSRCHLIRPGVDFSRVRRRGSELRDALGVTRDDRVLVCPQEAHQGASLRLTTLAASMLHVIDPRFRLVLWGRGPLAKSMIRFAHRMSDPQAICFAEQTIGRRVELEELLSAADAVVIAASGPVPLLPVAISMASGVPIVATVTPELSELLEDRHTALLAPPESPRLLAKRVLDLWDDPAMGPRLADVARSEAYRYLAQTRFVDEYQKLYQACSRGR